ncbi:MAG: hypothetical protein K2K20_01100 [Lachnospiraceae bacterium]|nr:hypothetical protein [Lachnospiraceae bacterium]
MVTNMEDRMGQSVDREPEAGQTAPIAAKRIAAAIGVFLLLALVAATFVVACIDFDGKEQIFSALLLCDIVIPVFLWVILHFFQKSGIGK